MRCIIKNIPPPTFGIAGNRGVGFPLTDYCSTLTQPPAPDLNCFLVKEESILTTSELITSVNTEADNTILVVCV